GKLRAESLALLAEGTFPSARLRVDTPALREDLAALRRLYPAFVPRSVLDAPPGALTLDASAAGTLRAPRVELAGALRQAGGGLLRLAAKGRPRALSGDARIDLEGLDLASFSAFTSPGLTGRVTGSIEVAGDRRAFTAALRLEGQDLATEKARIGTARLALDANADARLVNITRLTGEGLGRTFQAQGQGSRTAPWNAASLALSVQGLDPLLPAVDARVALRNGMLGIEIADLCALGAVGRLDATLPLGTLKKAPDLASSLSFLPDGLPLGPGLVRLESSTLDTAAILAALGRPARAERATFGLSLALEPDIANPWNSKGLARLTDLTIETKEATLHADAPVQLGYAGRVASVSNLRLVSDERVVADGVELALTAQAALDPKTKGFVRYLTVNANGRTDASLLAPFLEGAVAKGPLALEGHLAGPPDRLFGRVALSGREASFTWPSPYLTALQSPDLLLEVRDGAFTIRSGTALLNGGPVAFEGGFRDGDLDATARFSNVRYLLTYGLRASFDGTLRLQVPKEGLPLLSGTVALKRGLLDRDVDLDREILTRFLTPELAAAGGVGFLDTLGLDIDVTTDSGVKVVNNLADLRVDWGALEIRGTAREPVIRGRLTVDPGGTLSAYGQRFTLGKTVITYAGDPSSDPKIDATLTASTQDGAAGLPASFAAPGTEAPEGAAGTGLTAIAAGVAGYYGEQFATKLGQSLGFSRVTLRPVLVYGEADPGARLTLSRDFSRNVAFTFSLDLTNAQSQTYLLDLHGIQGLPSLTFQVFTNDAESWGGVVQQSLQLGGGKRRDTSLPVLHDVVFTGVDGRGVPKSKLKRAVKLRKGDSVPETAAFDIEVDLERVLRDAGFPDADVVTSFPKSARREGRVDLAVAVVPGPKTKFVFDGDRPPANARRAIAELYRGDFFEPATVEEMRRTTERAFRTLGHLAPAVTVAVTTSSNGERFVTITSAAGPKTPLPAPVFTGVTEGEAAALGQRFLAPADRAELALGTPDAERRLLAALRALGYPFAAIASRETASDGVVTVGLTTGGVTRVDSLEVTGVPQEESARLLALVPLKPGAPARSRDVAAGTLAIQDDLLARGFPEARVRSTLSPASPEIPPPLAIRYEVTAGPGQQLAGVRFEGLKSSSRSFLERVAGMSLGSPYRQEDVDAARSRLFGTGVFTKVTGERRDVPERPGQTEAVFTVEEKPRFTVAYGVRAESGAGAGFVLDLVDTNAFGRAITVGLRGLYEPKDRGGRFFVGSDDILGSKITAQAFLEMRRVLEGGEKNDDFVKSTTEASLQVSRFFGPRVNVRLYGRYRFTSLKERVPDPFFP
ncbi:MAG: translocation/assembly module TamB domain-containing protein, partial [Acidobacteria bacterium]|nr:translocation/assembly module TamB domain-containing protein [Acidobacteriota bacterium]